MSDSWSEAWDAAAIIDTTKVELAHMFACWSFYGFIKGASMLAADIIMIQNAESLAVIAPQRSVFCTDAEPVTVFSSFWAQ